MIVDIRQLLRNATGNFACPKCWYNEKAVVNPTHTNCPNCNVDLEWPEESIKAYEYFKEHGRKRKVGLDN